jgi:hypothetical protein
MGGNAAYVHKHVSARTQRTNRVCMHVCAHRVITSDDAGLLLVRLRAPVAAQAQQELHPRHVQQLGHALEEHVAALLQVGVAGQHRAHRDEEGACQAAGAPRSRTCTQRMCGQGCVRLTTNPKESAAAKTSSTHNLGSLYQCLYHAACGLYSGKGIALLAAQHALPDGIVDVDVEDDAHRLQQRRLASAPAASSGPSRSPG